MHIVCFFWAVGIIVGDPIYNNFTLIDNHIIERLEEIDLNDFHLHDVTKCFPFLC